MTRPRFEQELLRDYVRHARNAPLPLQGQPLWLLAPQWIDRAWRGRDQGGRFLRDISWAQYCLFFGVRLQDDLLDGQWDKPAGVFLANCLLMESERTFSQYFSKNAAFWNCFRDLVEETSTSILAVRRVQMQKNTAWRSLRRLYPQVSAVLKAASAAVCFRHKRVKTYPLVSRILDSSAFVGQVVDDLQDLESDSRAHSLNYAARRVLSKSGKTIHNGRTSTYRRVLRGVFETEGLEELFQELRVRVNMMRNDARKLGIRSFQNYGVMYSRFLETMERYHRDLRIQYLFGRPGRFTHSTGRSP